MAPSTEVLQLVLTQDPVGVTKTQLGSRSEMELSSVSETVAL